MDFFYSYETNPGAFTMKVVDAAGKIIWQSIHPAFITDTFTGQLIPDDTPMDLGFMKNLDDVDGLERHLKNSMLLNQDDTLSIKKLEKGGELPEILQSKINYISQKTGIHFKKSSNTNSWYGETKNGNPIRLSDHPSKFVERGESQGITAIDLNLDYYHPDAIVHLLSGIDPFIGYKEGNTITHSNDKIGDVTYLSSDYEKGYVEVKTKDDRTVKYDMNKFLGHGYQDKSRQYQQGAELVAKGGEIDNIKIPSKIFYVKVKPLHKGQKPFVVKLIPVKSIDEIIGFTIWRDNKKEGYADKLQVENNLLNKEYIIVDKSEYSKGGKLTPAKKEKLIKAVAKQYEGKKVKPKYQDKYGKRYSKKEAKSVAYAVANTVEKIKAQDKTPLKKKNIGSLLSGY